MREKKIQMQIFLALALLFPCLGYCENWFVPCKKAAVSKKFSPFLSYLTVLPYYDAVEEINRYSYCFAVDSKEFIVVDNNAGENFTGLYYFDIDRRKSDESSRESERISGGFVKYIREFSTKRKRFALISHDYLNHGLQERGFGILYLLPTKKKKPFEYYELTYSYGNQGCAGNEGYNACGHLESHLFFRDGSKQGLRIEQGGKSILLKLKNIAFNGDDPFLNFSILIAGKEAGAAIFSLGEDNRFILKELIGFERK